MRFDMSFDVTNIMPLAMYEEELEKKARHVAYLCEVDYPNGVPSEELEQMLKNAELWDVDLPAHILNILTDIDTI